MREILESEFIVPTEGSYLSSGQTVIKFKIYLNTPDKLLKGEAFTLKNEVYQFERRDVVQTRAGLMATSPVRVNRSFPQCGRQNNGRRGTYT